jgi:hypothetical protein
MNTITLTKTAQPGWLLAMWKEIDDKTFGKGFECFAEDAICNLGVADRRVGKRSKRRASPNRLSDHRQPAQQAA